MDTNLYDNQWDNPKSDIDYDKIRIVDDVNTDMSNELESLESIPTVSSGVRSNKKENSMSETRKGRKNRESEEGKKPKATYFPSKERVGGLSLIDSMPQKDIKDASQLKMSILRYKNVFPQHMSLYLDKMNLEYLDELSIQELIDFLDEIRTTVACFNSMSLVHTGYYGAVGMVEKFSPLLGFNLEGLTETVQNSPVITNQLNEISLQYDLIYVKPEIRLLVSTLASIQLVMNSNDLRKKERIQQPYNGNLEQEYSDI